MNIWSNELLRSKLYDRFMNEKDLNNRIIIAEEFNNLYEPLRWDKSIIPPLDIEVWADINGYEGISQISSFGRIKSVERFFIKNRRGGKYKMAVYVNGKIRTKRIGAGFGYLKTSIWVNGTPNFFSVHRLVAIHFIDNPNNHPQVCHKDDNPANANWSNLFWGTQSQNIKDCVDKGRWHIGIKNNKSKLNESDIIRIREMRNSGLSFREIGHEFNVIHGTIMQIINGKTWKHIK